MEVAMLAVAVGVIVILGVALVVEHIAFGIMIHLVEGTLAFQNLTHDIEPATTQGLQGMLLFDGGLSQRPQAIGIVVGR
jgi:hypothetical protein